MSRRNSTRAVRIRIGPFLPPTNPLLLLKPSVNILSKSNLSESSAKVGDSAFLRGHVSSAPWPTYPAKSAPMAKRLYLTSSVALLYIYCCISTFYLLSKFGSFILDSPIDLVSAQIHRIINSVFYYLCLCEIGVETVFVRVSKRENLFKFEKRCY